MKTEKVLSTLKQNRQWTFSRECLLSLPLILSYLLICGSKAHSDTVTLPIVETAVVSDGQGHSRILVRPGDWVPPTGAAIVSAKLVFGMPGSADLGRALDTDGGVIDPVEVSTSLATLSVYRVTANWSGADLEWTDWAGGSENLDASAVSITELSQPQEDVYGQTAFDITTAFANALAEGSIENGFLLATPNSDGSGIDDADASLMSDIGMGSIEVQFKRFGTALSIGQ